MTIYEKNLVFMKQYTPVLYNKLIENNSVYNTKLVELEIEDNFKIIYEGKECFANSQYDVFDELEETFQFVNKDCEVLIIFGIGNGEIIRYIKANFRNLKAIFIVEPFLDVFKRYVENNNFKEVFSKMGIVTFIINTNENDASKIIVEVFTNNKYASLEVVCLSSYFALLENYYEVLKERVLRGFRSVLMQLVTVNESRYMWLRNTLHNFRFFHTNQEDVAPLIKGKPAVIVAAGPSLNKHLHLLEELRKKAIIIGAGSAIKILNSSGIEPHFRMAIDGNNDESIYDETFYSNSKNIPLLYGSQVYDGILPKYEGEKIFMMLPTDLLGQYIYNKIEIPYEFVRSGASVVHSAFSFLCKAGCNPIIFIGQDMCFYENELYAKGISSIDQSNFNEKGWISQKDIYGNSVYTVRNYLQIKYDYEAILKEYPNGKFINATEGGLGIEGTIIKPLKKVMEEDLGEDLDIDFNSELSKISLYNKEKFQKILGVLEDANIEIDKILEINSERLKCLKKLKDDLEKNKKKINEFTSDFEYINKNIENKLKNIEFYEVVVLANISVQSIALKYKYKIENSDNEIDKLKKGVQYLFGIFTETEIFCAVCKDWIDEYINYTKEHKN